MSLGESQPNAAPPTETKSAAVQGPLVDSAHRSTVPRVDADRSDGVPDLPPGYRFVRHLGQGGMGEVFEVVHESMNVSLALKRIRLRKKSNTLLERFRREAEVMHRLNHPNIAQIREYAIHRDLPYFTMSLLTGGSLESRLSEFESNPTASLELLLKIASALGYAHRRKIVHRDLKPGNILFDEANEPFLSDFGLVKFGDRENDSTEEERSEANQTIPAEKRTELTHHGDVIGTISYMPREQLEGNIEQISPATDVWSFGVIAYQLLLGRKPFEANQTEVLIHLIRKIDPPSPREINPQLRVELARFLEKCLKKDPAERFPDGEAIHRELSRIVQPAATSRRWRIVLPLLVVLIGGAIWWATQQERTRVIDPTPEPKSISKPQAESLTLDERKAVLAELTAGKSVVIYEPGQPCRVPLVSRIFPEALHLRKDDSRLLLESTSTSLIELFPSLPFESYRLRVRLRMNTFQTEPTAGLYLGHGQFEREKTALHHYLSFLFEEGPASRVKQEMPGNLKSASEKYGATKGKIQLLRTPRIEVGLQLRLIDALGRESIPMNSKLASQSTPSPLSEIPPFHDLIVEVRPQEWKFWWDDLLVGTIDQPIPDIQLNPFRDRIDLALKPQPFAANDGLGIFLKQGSVTLERIELSPLPPAPLKE
jgi:serine/threonine protein kinase